MSPSCSIKLLGGIAITHPRGVRTRFGTHKCAVLLAYLAMHSDRVHSREQLADLLWPEMAPEAARHNLRQTLHTLRRLMESIATDGGSILQTDWHTVRLRAEALPSDVRAFEQAAERAKQPLTPAERQAVQEQIELLYQAELLPGWYEEWVALERTRLADVYANALQSLAHAWEDEGRPVQAVQCLEYVAAHDAFSNGSPG